MGQDENLLESNPSPVRKSGGRWKVVRRVIWTLLILFCLAAGTIGGVALYAANGIKPVQASDEQVRISIPKGSGSAEIAGILKKAGLIRDEFMFKMYIRYKNEGKRFQAGDYTLKPGATLDEIIQKLNDGDTVPPEMIKFTIPEGFTIEQMAEKLSEMQLINGQTFMELAQSPKSLNAYSVVYIPDDANIKYRLEGYLFPDTYEMRKGSTEQQIMDRMAIELDHKLKELPEDWKAKMEENGIDFHQMLTIASLIEEEVAVPEERPIVSGIIYNRLKKEMPLQLDATVQYALDEHKDRLYEKDTKIDSPYNTYQHVGLPPGPISSPSLASIRAALYPEQTEYLYYVTKKDGSHQHLFAETLAQHQRNIEKSKQMAQDSGQ